MENNQIENINLEVLKKNKTDDVFDLPSDESPAFEKGTNPLLWDKPVYVAVSVNSSKANKTQNPNAYWEEWAAKQNKN